VRRKLAKRMAKKGRGIAPEFRSWRHVQRCAKAKCLALRSWKISEIGSSMSEDVPSGNGHTMRMTVNVITNGRFYEAGSDGPTVLVPLNLRIYAEGGNGDLEESEPACVKLARRKLNRSKKGIG
jgi:hypothetical protein